MCSRSASPSIPRVWSRATPPLRSPRRRRGIWTNTGPNPTNPAQTYWKTINYQWAQGQTHKFIKQVRAELTYELSVWGNKQLFLVGRQEQTINQTDRSTAQVTSERPRRLEPLLHRLQRPELHPLRRASSRGCSARCRFWEWNTGHYATYQGKWWHDRI
jgi:hypothetical protein